MNIIIPMAGMGKRMRPHTLTTAKPLLPIAGKPIVQRLVEDILHTSEEAVEEIAFIISPAFGKAVEDSLIQIAESMGAKGRICYQETPLGTAHALLTAAESLKGHVLVAFADTLFKATFAIDTTKDAIIWTQRVDDPSAFGVVRLGENGEILEFVEKPTTFVSDQAIIGVYYFRDGERLRQELQRLIDENIMQKGEYFLTDAMDHMLQNGVKFYTDEVEEWLDCGNYSATVFTNQRMLELKHQQESLLHETAVVENSVIIQPCYLGKNVTVRNSVIGPHVSLEANATVSDSRLRNCIIGEGTLLENVNLEASMLGKQVILKEKPREWSLGDFSTTA
jgi:glucose-1-phosphate thymidylyltransferase